MSLDQSRRDNQGNFEIIVAGRTFQMPLINEQLAGDEPVIRFIAAAETVTELADMTRTVQGDVALSDVGKAQKLNPERDKILRYLGRHVVEIDRYSKRFDDREAKLLAVPELHREAQADAVIDGEIRSYWRSLAVSDRVTLMKRMAEEPGHERIQLALLRSPYALADLETQFVRESWNRAQRLANPAEAGVIDRGRVVAEWARRGFANLAGIGTIVSTYSKERVLDVLLNDDHPEIPAAGAAGAFGFDQASIRHGLARRAGAARQVIR